MGFKDLQLLVLLVWLRLGHTFANVGLPTSVVGERHIVTVPQHWSVNSTNHLVNILHSNGSLFSFDFMFTSRSKDSCAAVIQRVSTNTTVWVANFNTSNSYSNPVETCSLNFTRDAGLVLTGNGQEIWNKRGIDTLRLDDNGTLYFGNQGSESSFDYPGDTLIRSQTLKPNTQMKAADSKHMYSAGGVFSMQINGPNLTLRQTLSANGNKEDIVYEHVSKKVQLLNGLVAFDGNEYVSLSSNTTWDYLRLESDGSLAVNTYGGGQEFLVQDDGDCKLPGACGSFGICHPGQPNHSCSCPIGFTPSKTGTGLPTCERISFSVCNEAKERTDFVNITGRTSWSTSSKGAQRLSKMECETLCRQTCNCTIALHVGTNGLSGSFGVIGSCFLNIDSMQTIRKGVDESENSHTLFLRISLVAPGPSPLAPGSGPSSRRTAASAFAGGAGAFILLLLGVSAWWLVLNRRKIFDEADRGVYDAAAAAAAGKSQLPPRYTYEQLKMSTSSFKHVFGGSLGQSSVYFGTLPNHSDTKIAVKSLDDRGHKDKDFMATVATMGRLSHPNLVPLLGYCKEGRHKMLVYELVNEGRSLSWLLFDAGAPTVDVSTRRLIALGTAQGLQHLNHNGVMHGGVKPENILIDTHRRPKLVDYGLPDLGSTQTTTLPFEDLRGTRGYMAPELSLQEGQPLTANADVYSLGVVILELVSGRRCLVPEAVPEERRYLPAWGFALLRHHNNDLDSALELVDPRLDAKAFSEIDQQVLKGMVFVALCCVQADPALRPSMDEVVRMLEGGRTVNAPPTSPALDDYAHKLCTATPQGFIHSPSLSENSDMRPR